MTTVNVRYVDPNAAAGGDGTTNALTGEHCAYTSLAAWEAARQNDLVTADVIEKVICSSDDEGSTHVADTTGCTIDGWTTGEDNYIVIEAASSHGGKWNDGIYRMTITNGECLLIKTAYTKVSGIQMAVSTGLFAAARGMYLTAAQNLIEKCIIKGVSWRNGSQGQGIRADASGNQGAIRNCLVYGIDPPVNPTAIYSIANPGSLEIDNCTIVGCSSGIVGQLSTVTCKNVGVSGATTAFSNVSQTTCSSSTPTFVDADNDDYHLAEEDTTWRQQGTDLSAYFTDDIDGETRPTGEDTWDIGCDQYPVAPWYYYAQL